MSDGEADQVLTSYTRSGIVHIELYQNMAQERPYVLLEDYGGVVLQRPFDTAREARAAFRNAVEADLFDVVRK